MFFTDHVAIIIFTGTHTQAVEILHQTTEQSATSPQIADIPTHPPQ